MSTLQTQLVKKTAIIDSGDFNLSANRYLERILINSDYETVKISQIAELIRGLTFSRKDRLEKSSSSTIKVATTKASQSEGLVEKDLYIIDKNLLKDKTKILVKNDILISIANSLHLVGRTTFIRNISETITFGAFMSLIRVNSEKINPVLLNYFLKSNYAKEHFLSQAKTTTNISNLSSDAILNFEIPLPPLEIQEQIVKEIEGYQQIIDGCRQVVENYKPVIDIDPSWEMIELQEICDVGSSKRIYKDDYKSDGVPFYRTKEVVELEKGDDISLELFISRDHFEKIKEKYGSPRKNDILISAVGTIGISWVVNRDFEFYFKDGNLIWLRNINSDVESFFLKTVFDSIFKNNKDSLIAGAAYSALTIIKLKTLKVPLPKIETQIEIVEKLEQEKEVIEGNKELIKIYEKKINDKIKELF